MAGDQQYVNPKYVIAAEKAEAIVDSLFRDLKKYNADLPQKGGLLDATVHNEYKFKLYAVHYKKAADVLNDVIGALNNAQREADKGGSICGIRYFASEYRYKAQQTDERTLKTDGFGTLEFTLKTLQGPYLSGFADDTAKVVPKKIK